MLKARKKNRIVRIPEEKADEYKKLGYTLTDEYGNIVFQPEDKDATISALKLENARLKQQSTEYELLMKGKDDSRKKFEAMQAENIGLRGKLEEASAYMERADKRIDELEAKLKEASAYAEKADKQIEELEKELTEKLEPEAGEKPEAEDKADGKTKGKGAAAKKK